jgi:creatinine amidohydrolase
MDLLPLSTTVDQEALGVAVLPVGSFEQHGPYLPLATDTLVACAISEEIGKAYPVRRLPPITISCSQEHAAWPGTVSISARTLYSVVADIAACVDRLVLVNGHGGNYVLGNVVQEGTNMALFPAVEDWSAARAAGGIETPEVSDMHAGELETSILLHACPEAVREGYESGDHLADDRRHLLTLGLRAYTESGVVGRPSHATPAKGKAVLAHLVELFGGHLAALG